MAKKKGKNTKEQKPKEEKTPRGRPTKYKEEYAVQVYNYCLLGATDEFLAGCFGVEEKTINNWKKAHPNFLQSIKKGKEIADLEVAKSLNKRARGYTYQEVTKELTKESKAAATPNKPATLQVTKVVQKEMPPGHNSRYFLVKKQAAEIMEG